MELCVGMFGTCGGSTWRDPFTSTYRDMNIPSFNPQVDDWNESLAIVEAEHLANDAIILFPVTGETYGIGSLSECGFSILQAIRLDDRRDFVLMIDNTLDESLDDPALRKESMRARALVRQHLLKLRLPNVYIVDDLDTMLYVSLELYKSALIREDLAQFNPQNRG